MPGAIAGLAYQNKAVIYDILFKASAKATLTIAADPKRLGAKLGMISVLHSWGSAMTHHPHVHMIVPGGGFSLDGQRWIACRSKFFLPVRVLSRLFRRLFIEGLFAAHAEGRLTFLGEHAGLADARAFEAFLKPLRRSEWVVYAKRPSISNKRLIAADAKSVTFTVKDYRIEGPGRYKTMTLATPEFIRRFLMHVLPKSFHRIRHAGFLANGNRTEAIAKARELLKAPAAAPPPQDNTPPAEEPFKLERACPCCGGRMRVVEVFARGGAPSAKHDPSSRASPAALVIRLDTS